MKRWLLGVLAIVVVLFVLVVVAPIAALRFLNGILATAPGYVATAADLHLLPLEGAVAVDRVRFVRPEVPDASPFLEVERVVVTPHLRPLLHGDVIVDVVVDAPTVTLVVGPTEATSQKGIDPEWVAGVLRDYPVTFDHLRLTRGTVSFHDIAAKPDVALALTGLEVEGTNLSNLAGSPEEKFAHVTAKAAVLESGALEAEIDLASYLQALTFSLEANVRHVPLVRMNSALRAYGGFDVGAGTATVAMTMTATDGGYSGKADTVLTHVKLAASEQQQEVETKKKTFQFAKEAVMGAGKNVAEVTSKGDDQVRVPLKLQGHLDGPTLIGDVTSVLPKSWFGSLLHAVNPISGDGEKPDAGKDAEKDSQAKR